MSLYTIGDLHLSFDCDKQMDIFKGWEDYVERIKENWQATVKPDDTVVIVGDISWGMNLEQARADFEFIHKLNGTKILLKGNHDYWFVTKKKVDDFLAENGFDSIKMMHNNAYFYGKYAIVGTRGWINEQGEQALADQKILKREAGRLRASLEAANGIEPIAFMHYPPVYNTSECTEILQVLGEYGVKRCFYGHIHGSGHFYAIDGAYKQINYRLVACDYTQFRVVKVM